MPKALCLTGLVIAGLVFFLFLFDLVFGLVGVKGLAPFNLASLVLDVCLIIAAGLLAWMSWTSFRELK